MYERLDYWGWLKTLLTWDGALPLILVLAPTTLQFLFPANRELIELTAVSLPIAAFFARFTAGRKRIFSNHCSARMRQFQFGLFCAAIIALVFFDCIVVLLYIMPVGAIGATREERIVGGAMFAVYFLVMAFAMYPGGPKEHHL